MLTTKLNIWAAPVTTGVVPVGSCRILYPHTKDIWLDIGKCDNNIGFVLIIVRICMEVSQLQVGATSFEMPRWWRFDCIGLKSAANCVCLICGIIWPCCELFLVVLANHYFLQGLVRQKITFPLLHQSSLSRYINKNRIFQIDGMWFSHCFCSLKSGLNLKMDNSEKICSD